MKLSFRIFLPVFFLFLHTNVLQAAEFAFPQAEDSLRILASRIFKAKTDAARMKANDLFLSALDNTLKQTGSFEYPFDSLTDIGKLLSPDGTFRIYNWNIQKDDATMLYFGFIQRPNPKTGKVDLFLLDDKTAEIRSPESQSLDYRKWLGALYYKIIRNKSGKNIYYTLLGLDEHSNLTWRKLIDVLWFDREGTPHFGESIFTMGKFPKKRIIFEFRSEMIMALKYNEEKGMIIFDNLAPEAPEGKGIYENYVMDGSYNGLVFKKGKWQFIADVNALNPTTKNDKFYEDPRGTSPKKGSNTLGPPKKAKNPGSKTQ